MSFDAKKPAVRSLQLKVQRLSVRSTDTAVYDANGGNGKFDVGEDVKEVVSVLFLDDSAASIAPFAQSAISASGSEITVTGLALAADDVAMIEYVVDEEA